MTQAEARLAEFDRRRDEILREWRLESRSGRLLTYIDVRKGEVIEAGEIDTESKPWTGQEIP